MYQDSFPFGFSLYKVFPKTWPLSHAKVMVFSFLLNNVPQKVRCVDYIRKFNRKLSRASNL